jgi:HSP20 family protein
MSQLTVPTREAVAAAAYQPLVDILETPDAVILRADLPGVKHNGLDVTFEDGSLRIVGKVAPRTTEVKSFVNREYGVGDFRRSFYFDIPIKVEAISAELKSGELTVTLPKTDAAKTRKVPVYVA